MNRIETYALDLGERALSTFWQAAAPVFAGAQLTNWSELKAAAAASAVAGGAAVLSLIKGVMAGARTGTGSTSLKVAAGADATAAAVSGDVSLADA